jgi:Zn-dependent protease
MRGSLKLGNVFGIPIHINYTWFIILILMTVQLATLQFPQINSRWPAIQYWAAGLITAILLFVSVLIHELAHSLVSRSLGTPVEGITLFIFGGVSSISEDSRRPQDELIMAAVGPLSSVVLAGAFWVLSQLAPNGTFVYGAAVFLAATNAGLAIFNMVPGFPLDGGRVLRSLIWWGTGNMRIATRWASTIGRVVAALMIVSGLLVALVFRSWQTGLWLAFIGWFLENAAAQSYRQFLLKENLAGVSARDLMTSDCVRIEGTQNLQAAVDEHLLREGRRCIMVTRGDTLAGLLTVHRIKDIPRSEWPFTSVAQAMIPFDQVKNVDVNASAMSVLKLMDEGDINQMPVLEAGRLVGAISRDRLLRFIRTKAELGM